MGNERGSLILQGREGRYSKNPLLNPFCHYKERWMKISEIFNLEKSQPELDFVDIDVEIDTPLFIDPFFLGLKKDNWSTEASNTIRNFFQRVINLIRDGDLENAKQLFIHLHEPNSTCLGVSRGTPQGRGVGSVGTDGIFRSILESRAIQSGLIEDLEDNILFVDGFGKDKLSDMTTNIIRKHLIEYTIGQCKLHGIPMQSDVPSEFYWNRGTNRWERELCDSLVIDGKKILLVPKGAVSFCRNYIPQNYYQHYVLNFMQNEHLQMSHSPLVKRRMDETPYVTKKDLIEIHPFSKAFIANFTRSNPEVLENFKRETKTTSLANEELDDVNIEELINHLIDKLESIEPGNAGATEYHRTIMGVLEILFYPHLIYPSLEQEIHEGRKRIDLTFDNAATDGIFFRLHNSMGISCQYMMVECKNYSSDPTNPELDQLSSRFSPNRGRVGFLLCRTIDDLDRFISRCRDTYTDQRGLIIPLTDGDVITLLRNHNDWNSTFIERFLSDRVRQITIN